MFLYVTDEYHRALGSIGSLELGDPEVDLLASPLVVGMEEPARNASESADGDRTFASAPVEAR